MRVTLVTDRIDKGVGALYDDDVVTIDWLMVWVHAAGCGQHTTTEARVFLQRLVAVAAEVMNTEVHARITPDQADQLDALNEELTHEVFGSLPDSLVARWQDGDPNVQMAVLCALYLWILYATDALTLPRGNVQVWRYHLLSTAADARAVLATAV